MYYIVNLVITSVKQLHSSQRDMSHDTAPLLLLTDLDVTEP